jgi:hypothetical protein
LPQSGFPIAFLVRGIAAWVYVFSYEPGIAEKAVRIHYLLRIPGVFFSVECSTVINIALGSGPVLFVTRLAVNFALAMLATAAYNRIVRGNREEPGNP